MVQVRQFRPFCTAEFAKLKVSSIFLLIPKEKETNEKQQYREHYYQTEITGNEAKLDIKIKKKNYKLFTVMLMPK